MSDERLEVTVGSVLEWDILLVDEDGNGEPVSGWAAATLAVKDGDTEILVRTTVAGNLSINTADKKLVATLTQEEADALSPGVYVGEAAGQTASGWVHTDPFMVEIEEGRAPHA